MLFDIAYGHKLTGEDDPYIISADKAMVEIAHAGRGLGILIDFFPKLKHWPTWLSGSGFKRHAYMTQKLVGVMKDEPYKMVISNMASGKAPASFLAELLEEFSQKEHPSPEEDADIKDAAATYYGAGSDTVTIALLLFTLCMVKHPEAFKKAQEEIDRVIGHDRLPDFEDRELLPYLNALLKELLRWHLPFLLGIPHQSMQDDEYRGYHIPRGSLVIANVWNMSRNDAEYPEPEEFRPERFLSADSTVKADPREYAFGFGRRICPGKEFADASLFLVVANIVATMNISKAKDAQGNQIDPPPKFLPGVTSRPAPFHCSFTPRSQKTVQLIHQMHESTKTH